MKVAVIYNPRAGRRRGEDIASTVEDFLGERGAEVTVHPTRAAGDGTVLARQAGAVSDVVVAVGGDGTVNEILNGMVGTKARLAIVPAGTVNVLALELRIPFHTERACAVIAEGHTKVMDLGRANKRYFILMMGAGIDALTIRNLDPKAKQRFHELAFVSTGLRLGLSSPPRPFIVRTNEEEHRATFLVAGNSRYYGGRFGLTTEADPTDGLLDILMFKGTTSVGLGVFWLGVPYRLHLRNKDVTYLRSAEATVLPIDEDLPVWYQTDGELAGSLPASLNIEPQAIEVLVPERERGH